MKHGLFVGLVTLDLIYLTEQLPSQNQKIVALDYSVAAGGPATNAAIAFSYLGSEATILGVIGNHPLTHLIRTDIENYNVAIADLDPTQIEPPPVSSIVVTQSTGDRTVISLNATKTQTDNPLPFTSLQGIDIVLIDGHQMKIGQIAAKLAKSQQIPVVIDGGSWKAGFDTILPHVDYAICSANFLPPNCKNSEEAIAYLQTFNIPHIAITQGEKPIQYLWEGKRGEIPIPSIQPVDTLGAGDVFHGAFAYHILQKRFPEALLAAANVASRSCQSFGTRQWMQ